MGQGRTDFAQRLPTPSRIPGPPPLLSCLFSLATVLVPALSLPLALSMSNQQPPADERQPLLAASSTTSADDPSSNLHAKVHADDVASHGSTRQLIKQELVYLSRKSPPLIVGFLLESSVSLLTVAIAGRCVVSPASLPPTRPALPHPPQN